MPQLMPLSWIFSGMMVMIAVMTASIIYSDKSDIKSVSPSLSYSMGVNKYWCW
uniref:ATP synthase F0 subunit 8 n=1 Tax=Araniella displicata TaxID=336630 RepID=UPI0020792E14|nr:ATP synthase F0 subunit 8 [Araniella displicata]URW97643.1 ATP synthase F0 subunit 8 [Araniella displicata]